MDNRSAKTTNIDRKRCIALLNRINLFTVNCLQICYVMLDVRSLYLYFVENQIFVLKQNGVIIIKKLKQKITRDGIQQIDKQYTLFFV